MRIAVVGVGTIGAPHARIFRDDPRCTLLAVCDADDSRVKAVADDLGCRAYTDFRSLLAAEELDAVSIATPESARHGPAVAAARLGLRLLLEKPLGRTFAEVRSLVEELRGLGAKPTVNFILHAEPRFARMKELVRAGAVGQLVSIFARRRGTRGGIEKYAPWTDLLSSTLIHDIEMTLRINNSPPERAYAEAVVRECAEFGSQDAVVATLRFADGTIALFESSWVLPKNQPAPLDPAFHVVGDGGLIAIEGADQGMQVLEASGLTRPDFAHWPISSTGRIGGALSASLGEFVTRALAGEPPLSGLEEAYRAEAVVAAMKQSLEVSRPVQIDDME